MSSAQHYDMVYHLQLYHSEGSPHLQAPVFSDTIIAGTSDTLVAKIFDRNNIWYPGYEKPDSGRMYIRWKVEAPYDGSASIENNLLSDTVGHLVIFKPRQGYRTYRIIASFKGVCKNTANIVVKPFPRPNILTIQTEKSNKISIKMDIDTLLLTKVVTSVYAVIRDPFGNFVHYSKDAVWSSSDTTSIVTTPGNTSAGECILTATTANFISAKVIVRDKKEGLFDTLTVINNIVNTAIKEDKNFAVISNPVFYTDQGKLRIQFPFTANRTIRFYTLSGNCVNLLKTSNKFCSVVLQPGVYVVTIGVAGMNHPTSIRVLVSGEYSKEPVN
jgi:hypothetical protein